MSKKVWHNLNGHPVFTYLEEGHAVVDLVHAGEEDEHVAGRLHRVQPQHGVHAALDVVGARLFSV